MTLAKKLLSLGGSSGFDYYFGMYVIGSGTTVFRGVDFDSDDNIYVAGLGLSSDAALVKILPGGSLFDAYTLAGVSGYLGCATNSNDEIFVAGNSSSGDARMDGYELSGGDLSRSWHKELEHGSNTIIFYNCALAGTSDVYACGYNNSAAYGGDEVQLAKYSQSDGSLTWQKTIGSALSQRGACAVDGSGNPHVVTRETVTRNAINVMKIASSGASITWQRTLEHGSSAFSVNDGMAICLDASDNVYAAATLLTSDKEIHIVKYNSSGTIQWQRSLSDSGADLTPHGLDTDSSGNVYIAGEGYDGANFYILVAKYNASGTLQWKNTWQPSTPDNTLRMEGFDSLRLDSNEDIVVVGSSFDSSYLGDNPGWVLKLPNDGSLTGTHGDWSYATATGVTSATPTNTDAAGGLNITNSSYTNATRNVNDFNASEDATVYEVD